MAVISGTGLGAACRLALAPTFPPAECSDCLQYKRVMRHGSQVIPAIRHIKCIDIVQKVLSTGPHLTQRAEGLHREPALQAGHAEDVHAVHQHCLLADVRDVSKTWRQAPPRWSISKGRQSYEVKCCEEHVTPERGGARWAMPELRAVLGSSNRLRSANRRSKLQ